MKKFLIFVAGVVTGVALVLLFFAVISKGGVNDGKTMFDTEREYIGQKHFEVFQVLEHGDALAKEKRESTWGSLLPTDIVVLLLNEDGMSYYDGQTIEVPSDKTTKQIGVYKYQTKSEMWKTVPIVVFR